MQILRSIYAAAEFNRFKTIWQADYLSGVKKSTAFLYKSQIELYIRPKLSKIRLDNQDAHTIQRVCNALGKK